MSDDDISPPAVENGLASSSPASPADKSEDSPALTPLKKSLNSIYGNRIGLLQSLSMVLNTATMIYAHVGISAVFVSNQQNVQDSIAEANATKTNQCLQNPIDLELWSSGGAENKAANTDYCSRGFKNPENGRQCLVDTECFIECYHSDLGYTRECSACFAQQPICNVQKGCLGVCYGDPYAPECVECNLPCDAEFEQCSGLEIVRDNNTTTDEIATTSERSNRFLQDELIDLGVCERQKLGVDYENYTDYFTVYEILFFDAVETAWYNDARLLAVIVVLFSGIWPYAKNIFLMVAWYGPWTTAQRAWLLRWLRRLGKYTLVDIYVVIMLIVGVQIQLMVADGTVPVVVKGEPRGGIIAFLVATVHEFMQIEWMTHCHQKALRDTAKPKVEESREETTAASEPDSSSGNLIGAMRFQGSANSDHTLMCKSPFVPRAFMAFMVVATVLLFVTGTILENIRFVSVVGDDTEGCVQSYNLYSLGTAMISDFSLYENDAKPGIFTLYVSYILFLAVLPILVHSVHLMVCIFQVNNLYLCRLADLSSTFASIEVFILGLFVVQYKFEELIGALAGNESSEFFGIKAELGPGFFILIAYSIISGLLHYFFNRAVAHHYHLEHPTVDYWWTALVRGCLQTDGVD